MITSTLKVFLAAVILSLIGCDEPEGQIGSRVGILPGGEAVTEVFYADMDTSFAVSPAPTGGSKYLYVGEAYGVTAKTLIKFNRPSLSDEWDVWTLDSSRVEMIFQGGIGEGANTPVEAKQINLWVTDWRDTTRIWTEYDTLDASTFPAGIDMTVEDDFAQGDTGMVRILPDFNWVFGWLYTTGVDSGLTIMLQSPDAVDRLRKFHSRASGDFFKPRLVLFLTVRNATREARHEAKIEVFPSGDAFIATYDTTTVGSTDLLIGSGAAYRSFIHFNLDMIDTLNYYVVVNRAMLTLHRKQIVELLPVTLSISHRALYCDSLNGDSLDIDNLRASVLKSFNNLTPVDTLSDEQEVVITSVVADWLLGKDANHWLALHSWDEGSGIDRIAFHSAAGDTALDPGLTVYYTRFER